MNLTNQSDRRVLCAVAGPGPGDVEAFAVGEYAAYFDRCIRLCIFEYASCEGSTDAESGAPHLPGQTSALKAMT
jgi:hypothetical protein